MFALTPFFHVNLVNQRPDRHAYIEQLVRSWYGMRKYRHLASFELVRRACQRAKKEIP